MNGNTYGFIGLGLIGGSIAKAIKDKIPSSTIIAYDINKDTLQLAYDEKIVDQIAYSIDCSFSDCDFIFLCAPVQKNDENLSSVKKILSDKCILTDVGSVKNDINKAIHDAGLERYFIGGHPMAGSERVGYVNSKAVLLENAYYILAPNETTKKEMLDKYYQLVTTIGAIPIVLSPQEHDYVTAGISHLPHVIAASLVNLVHDHDSPEGIMKMVAAGGFKDITRIASSQATMWQQICLTNADNISSLLGDYIEALQKIKTFIDQKDSENLYTLFDNAREYRDSFINTPSGPIKTSYTISIAIADKQGALATITTMLAVNNINIKNIGILHNRESENGVLKIELYDEASREKAKEVLKQWLQ